MAYIRYRSQTVAIEVCFPFSFAVVFDFIHFRFRPSKAKSIGNVLTSRQSAALRSIVFFLFRIAYWRTESYCVLRQCGVNRKKSLRNTILKLKTLQNWIALPKNTTCIISADNNVLSLVFPRCTGMQRRKLIKKKETQQEIRCVLPICQLIAYYWFCFTGVETEIHEIEGNSKIKREKNIETYWERLAPSRHPFLVTDYL